MNCLRKWLSRLGLVDEVDYETRESAITENLERQRAEALENLQRHNEKLMEVSEDVSRRVDNRKEDLDSLLTHLNKITTGADDAARIIRRMIDREGR